MATMGNRFGRDFSQVRVHDDAVAARSARAIDADGYAVGSDVVLRSYDPQSAHGERLLAHELAHVTQDDRRDSASALQLDDPQSEAERDATRWPTATPAHAHRDPEPPASSTAPSSVVSSAVWRALPEARFWVGCSAARSAPSSEESSG